MYPFILFSILVSSNYAIIDWRLPISNLPKDDGYGSLLAMNEEVVILAQNGLRHFQIIFNPFTNDSHFCTSRYISIQHGIGSFVDYIYSISIGSKQQYDEDDYGSKYLYFAFIDEDRDRNVHITIVYYDVGPCVSYRQHLNFNVTDLVFIEQAIIGMDPHGTRVYAIGYYYTVVIDIATRTGRMYHRNDVFGLGPTGPPPLLKEKILTFSKAMAITDNHRLYLLGQRYQNFQYLAYLQELDFFDLTHNNVRLHSFQELSPFNFGVAGREISRFSMMSIFLDEEQQLIIVGIPHVDTVLLLSFNKNHGSTPKIIKRHESRSKGISFGKSVTLFDDKSYAVLAYNQSTSPWSTSQVQVYHLEDVSNQPLFVFPNNQQTMQTMNNIQPPYGILTLTSYKMNIALVVEVGGLLLLPSSPPGYYSSQINNNLLYIDKYISIPCPVGTARNTSSFGPCFICPPQTKNNGSTGIDCEKCSSNVSRLCLRGAKNEIEIDRLTSFDQADPYPDSQGMTDFGDVLVRNVFQFGTSYDHCLTSSPLFWTMFSIGLSSIAIVIISILTYYSDQRAHHKFMRMICTFSKKIFTHLDLISHGELWFGGLVSVALIILVGFTFKLSISFSNLYPIENIDFQTHKCHPNLYNSKFTTALQLRSIRKHTEEEPIHQLLDEQNITLTVEFVSTDFLCESISMQRDMNKGQKVPSFDFICIVDNETSIRSVLTVLPQHTITVQFTLTGSSFVGGLRICLHSPLTTKSNAKYTARALKFCQLFFTPNETVTMNSVVHVKMTKSINRTAPFSINDGLTLTGIWLPAFSMNTLADTLLFEQNGKYRRYLFDRMILSIDLTESEFYLENTQEPLARRNDIIFQTVLFSMLCLDLFALLFLFVKLVIGPFILIIGQRYIEQNVNKTTDKSQLTNTPMKEPIEIKTLSSNIKTIGRKDEKNQI